MSTLKIYQCDLTPERNALVDNISTYLSSDKVTYTSTTFQYVQLGLDITIKIDASEAFASKSCIGNYVSIYQDGKLWYYFIMSAKWRAKQTVELSLSIDSINTFNGDFTFTNKTHIIRQHKNRFSNTEEFTVGTNTLYEVVDDADEGVNGAIQYKVSDNIIYHGGQFTNQKWYLVYESKTDEDATGIKCTLYPETPVPYSGTVTQKVSYSSLTNNYVYYISGRTSPRSAVYFINDAGVATSIANGESYKSKKVLCIKYYKIVGTAKIKVEVLLEGNDDWTSFDKTGASKGLTPRGASGYTTTTSDHDTVNLDLIENFTYHDYTTTIVTTNIESINFVDRTSSKLVKIIELPYCPADFQWDDDMTLHLPTGWNFGYSQDQSGDHYFIIPNITTEFGSTIISDKDLGLSHTTELTEEQLTSMSLVQYKRNVLVSDPKLKHSSLYTYKLVYDSYSLPIPFEKINQTQIDLSANYNVYFKPSNTISSNLGFRVDFQNSTYTTSEDYGTYLIATRNNESPIYNNSYIDYLRTGYRYDRKAQTTQNTQTWIAAGVQLIGGIAAAVVGGAASGGIGAVAGVALISSGISTLSSAIFTTVKSEQSIQSKLAELKAQATSVSGADDLNLLNWYNENKLHIMEYRVSDRVYKLMDDAFYYYGYADDVYAIPKFKTRFWFNYIQCEPRFKEETTSIYQDYVADIKARYAAGVTVYHMFNNTWDFTQTKENWESVLIPIY